LKDTHLSTNETIMSKIDKTRENLKVESLERDQRKQLFNKFVKAGGQVIQEKKPRPINIDRNKQMELQRRLDDHNKKFKTKQTVLTTSSKGQLDTQHTHASNASGAHVLFARIRLWFMGVSNFGGTYFKKKFLDRFKGDYNAAMIELQMVFLDIFKQKPLIGHKIIDHLDTIRPLYFELIEMTSDIYESSISSQIIDRYTALPDERYRIFEHRVSLLSYFRKLYILHSFAETIQIAFNYAIDTQEKMMRGKSSLFVAKKKKVKNSLYILFNKFFPRLYWIFSLIHGEIVELSNSPRFDELLDIVSSMKPGIRSVNQPSSKLMDYNSQENYDEQPVEKTAEEDISEQVIPDLVKKGLALMDMVDFASLRKEVIKDDLLINVSENDMVMNTYLLFIEFDREYSFILTTYKIKFTPAYSMRGKSDFRTILSDIYNNMRPCFDALKDYFIALDIYEKSRDDRPISHDLYYKYTKRLAELDHEKKQSGLHARKVVLEYMNTIIQETAKLIEDMNLKLEIVQNPQEIINFDSSLEAERIMRGKKVYEVIASLHAFASAFYYRLSPGGDLFGDPESGSAPVLQEKPAQDFTVVTPSPVRIIPKRPEPKQPANDTTQNEAPKKKSSILGELDDLL
jgi:hypothetical protein